MGAGKMVGKMTGKLLTRIAVTIAMAWVATGCATADRATLASSQARATTVIADPAALADARARAERRYALDIENLAYVPGPERVRAEAAALVRYETALAEIAAGRAPGDDYPMPTEQVYASVAANSRYVAAEPLFQFEPVDLASLDDLGSGAEEAPLDGVIRSAQAAPDARDRLAGGPVRIAETELPAVAQPADTIVLADAPSDVGVGGPLVPPAAEAVLVSTQITLSGADVFASGAATPTARALDQIDSAVRAFAEFDRAVVFVHGHADATGPDAANLALSRRRADAVAAKLVAAGIPADRVTIDGFGETRPVADNTTAEGRARNRRVEIIIQPVSLS